MLFHPELTEGAPLVCTDSPPLSCGFAPLSSARFCLETHSQSRPLLICSPQQTPINLEGVLIVVIIIIRHYCMHTLL